MAVFSRKQIETGETHRVTPVVEEQAKSEKAHGVDDPTPEPDLKPRRPRVDDPWYALQHPDATDGNQINATIDVAGEKVIIERSRVETQSQAVREELLKRGWRWMNEEF